VGESVGAEVREGKGDQLEFKERSRRISGKVLIQVRGAFTCVLTIIVCFRALLDGCNVYSEFVSNFVEFLEISRNRLAGLKDRQAAHATSACFLSFDMHRLAAKGSPPGDTNWVAQFPLIFGYFRGVRGLGEVLVMRMSLV